jgi:signal transduction histidine kinase
MNAQGKQISAKTAKKAYVSVIFVGLLGTFLFYDTFDVPAAGDATGLNHLSVYEGLVSDWNYAGSQGYTTYTNLISKKKVFRIIASNHNGSWNKEGASLAVIISSSFWETIWFYGSSALFALCLMGGFYFLRIRSMRARNNVLEKKVSEQAAQLEKFKNSQCEVVEKAHKAGMADIASGVLHNVGNVLNSVNTSSSLIREKIKKSKLSNFIQANAVLRENIDEIGQFISGNPKGKKLMEYYLSLEEPMKKEQDELLRLIGRLTEKTDLINEVIAAQQNYAGASRQMEAASLSEMIDNALSLQAGSIERHSLNVKKMLNATDQAIVNRSKLIHVLVNIIKNAIESMEDNHPENKYLVIETWLNSDMVHLSVTDNGKGIEPEHLEKIFSHAFTTKKNGHGFGLHSSANYMTEMGGKIEVASEGLGKGATLTLFLPKHTAVGYE